MDSNDPLCLICDLFFDLIRVNLPGICRTVHKYRCCPCVADTPGRCNVGICRNNHFIPRSYTKCSHCTMQGAGTIIDTRCVRNSHIFRKLPVKLICIFPTGKGCFLTDSLNCL